jgi:WD40 repeat protein
VEEQGTELRQNLYLAEMNLAGQAAQSSQGLGRVDALLSHWRLGQPDFRGWEWYYLLGRCHQDLLTISDTASVSGEVVWSPDGTRLATMSPPKVWDAATGKESVILAGPKHRCHSIAWSPNGALLASANWRPDLASGNVTTIIVWDALTGKQRLVFPTTHTQEIVSVAWAPDSTRLATGDLDKRVLVHDAKTGKAILNTRLASASADGAVKIWDPHTGSVVITFRVGPPQSDSPRTLAWSPDGLRLAVGYAPGNGLIYGAANGYRLAGAPMPSTKHPRPGS